MIMFFLIFSDEKNSPLRDIVNVGAFVDQSKKSEFDLLLSKGPPRCEFTENLKKRKDEQDKKIAGRSRRQSSSESVVSQKQEVLEKNADDKNGNNEVNLSTEDSAKVTMMSTIDDFIRVDLVNFLLTCCIYFI